MRTRSGLLLLLLLSGTDASETPLCESALSVAVDSFSVLDNGTLKTPWGASYTAGTYWRDGDGVTRVCPCEPGPCLRKCCPRGQVMRDELCTGVDADPDDFRRRHADFSLLFGSNCPCGRYIVPGGQYNLLSNGSLNQSTTEINAPADFCLEDFENGEGALACFPSDTCDETGVFYQLYPMGMVVSLPCLIATLLVYAVIEELRNLHGLSLMSYVSCLAVGYTFLAVIQWGGITLPLTTCYPSAFIIYFSFLASFFWLNVMCLDIFWTFSGFRSLRGTVKEREFKKFIIYSIYSWGCPLIMLTVCLVMHFHEGIPDDYVKPGFGINACWFQDTISALAYFYGPVAVLILCNIILFILTAVKIAKLKREADMFNNSESRRHDDEDNKQRFNLYLKLFLVMGVNWATEIISWAAGGPEYLWYLTDIANTLQGVLIFIIFVWKDRIRKLLMERFCPKRAASATVSKSTAITFSSRGSSSISSVKPGGKINQESLRMTNMVTSEESDVP